MNPPETHPSSKSKVEEALFKALEEKSSGMLRDEVIRDEDGWMFPDILFKGEGVIVEMYGDYWHANPRIFSADDIVHHGISAKEIWDKDAKREKRLTKLGYMFFAIWESDFKKDPDSALVHIVSLIEWESCAF